MAVSVEAGGQDVLDSVKLSPGELLRRRILRLESYKRVVHRSFDRLVSWPRVNGIVESRAHERGDGFIVVQVGANDGQRIDPLHKLFMRHRWQGLLVEPEPVSFAALQRTYAGHDHLQFAQLAVSSQDGTAPFYAPKFDVNGSSRVWGNGSLHSDAMQSVGWMVPNAAAAQETITVRTATLPSLLGEYDVSAFDYLVVDTEGHDGLIVNQALDLPADQTPSMILYEHCNLGPDEGSALRGRLHGLGYETLRLMRDTFAWQQ